MDLIVLDLKCINCGVEFHTVSQVQKMCTECQRLHRAEVIRRWLRRKEERQFTNFVGGGE